MTLEERIRRALQDPARRPSPDFGDRVMSALPAERRDRSGSPRALLARLGTAATIAAVLLIGVVGPAVAPNGRSPRSSASMSPAPGVTAPRVAARAIYPDGMPREIDGQPVLRGVAIGEHAAASRNDAPFLVGGYGSMTFADCYVDPEAPGSPLLTVCDDGFHLRDSRTRTGGGNGPRLVVDGVVGIMFGDAPAVYRVHVHDPRARACGSEIRPRCDAAIVVDAVVWVGPGTFFGVDGIPTRIGAETVLRGGDEIAARVGASPDDTTFLIGGWATGQIMYRCPAATDRPLPRTYESLRACGAPAFHVMEGPDRDTGVVVVALGAPAVPAPGPVVLRVHVHDPLAVACPDPIRPACETTVVLDEVVWTQP